jgi:hypothetical protein
MHAAHLHAECPKVVYIEASKIEIIEEEEGHEGEVADVCIERLARSSHL